MKKWLMLLLLCACLVLGVLVGCSGQGDKKPNDPGGDITDPDDPNDPDDPDDEEIIYGEQ